MRTSRPHVAAAEQAQDAMVADLRQAIAIALDRLAERRADVVATELKVLDHHHGFEHVADLVSQVGVVAVFLGACAERRRECSKNGDFTAFGPEPQSFAGFEASFFSDRAAASRTSEFGSLCVRLSA